MKPYKHVKRQLLTSAARCSQHPVFRREDFTVEEKLNPQNDMIYAARYSDNPHHLQIVQQQQKPSSVIV
jgi:hypothetical protein